MNSMRLVVAVAGLVVSLVFVGSALSQRKVMTTDTLSALESWVQAVKTHMPGRSDASVASVAALSYETRQAMDAGMGLFLAALMAETLSTDGSAVQKEIVALGHASGMSFLKRAAVLHSDAAAYTDLFSSRSSGATSASSLPALELQVGRSMPTPVPTGDHVSPLLRADRVILDKDGQVLGQVLSTWQWPFARSLLDLLSEARVARLDGRAELATDPFVAMWYHATLAYMFASGLYGEATSHLKHAAEVLPGDARILFDRGCYAESLGLPMHQALVADPDANQRAVEGGAPTWRTPGAEDAVRIPSAGKTNAEAERMFRRALTIDPSLIEVRIRLARLLDLRGRHEEAAAELKTALAGKPTGVVAFYAHLFAGRAAQSMGQVERASGHYREATALFPDAQSALLASSQLALLRSDVPATLAPVQQLGTRSSVFTADPWWQYHLCAGRDADDLLKRLWASVPR